MKHKQFAFALVLIAATLLSGQDAEAKRRKAVIPNANGRGTAIQRPAATKEDLDAKVIRYSKRNIVQLKAKLRYSTVIILPKDEQILDFICGDKDFWIVDGEQNFATVKPAKANSSTNLNLVTASGNVYSFVLQEVSELPNTEPDYKVFVELGDDGMVNAVRGKPKFVPIEALDDYREQVNLAKDETKKAKQSAQAVIDDGITKFLGSMRFPYRFDAGKRPFNIRAIYHDDRFTYIRARPEEIPTLYEVKDGIPNFVNFEYKDGAYVASKIIDSGYLAIGDRKQKFVRQD